MAVAVRPAFAELVRHLYEAAGPVRGQEKSKRRLALLLARQKLVSLGERPKSRAGLIAGKTGTGKTMMARLMCGAVELPFSEANATQFTEAGYTGRDLTHMFIPLIESASDLYDERRDRAPYRLEPEEESKTVLARPDEELEEIVEVAETGVVLLDEFDKWLFRINHMSGQLEKGIQAELLKMIEGSREWLVASDEDDAPGTWFDTGRVLILCCGAFVGLSEKVQKRQQRIDVSPNDQGFWDLVEPEDFVSFGLMPELAGRLHFHVMLHGLTERHLSDIIGADGGPLEEYRLDFEATGVRWELGDGDLLKLANQAAQLDIGARSVDFVLANVFGDALFQATAGAGGRVRLDESGNRAVIE